MLMTQDKARTAYQQNDYIGWITQAKRDASKNKCIDQMLDELRQVNVYIKMSWGPLRKQ